MNTQETEFDVRDAIRIHVDTESGEEGTGWVYTDGMAALGCPELEICGIPLFLTSQAASLLNHVAQYIVDRHRAGEPVKAGQTMGTGEFSIFRFVQIEPIPGEDVYEHGRWALSDEPMRRIPCDHCKGCEKCGDEKLN